MYKKTKNPIYAQKLIEFYSSKKNFSEAISFLKESGFDDMILLDIYTAKKDFKSAMALAQKLYEKDNNPTLLAKSAILEYESSQNKDNKTMLKSVQKKFEQVIDTLKNSMYYNYYGYILIEHEIDIDKGIKLVKKALKDEPNSDYYIDSLAWGMYKKGECAQASILIDKISKEESDQKEIREHKQLIKNCTKAKEK
jgi:tetratricopeptide (TPR) repeat protein